MNRSKVSVIIPCYNAAAYIIEALESLERQEQMPDEVICINDGSTDNTEELIEHFAKSCALHIILISQSNSGVSVARNTGIAAASGTVLFFLDADDRFSPCFIKQASKGIDDGYDAVYGYYTHDSGNMIQSVDKCCIKSLDKRASMSDFMYHKNRCHTSAFAYRRSLIVESGLQFTAGVKYGEDWEFTSKYLDLCHNVLCVQAPILFYRLSDNSVMRRIVYDHVDAIKAAERVEQYLRNQNSDCYELFSSYMKHRAIFSVAHTFAKYSQKDMFKRLCVEYPVTESMRVISTCSEVSLRVKLAAFTFRISKWLFYYITGKR